jgi:hypothetical protein
MGERRKAKRYEVCLPLQVCISRRRSAEYDAAHLRDISRTGIYFQSSVPIEIDVGVELTFSLPTDQDGGTSVLVRASARTIRVEALDSELSPIYGVAATIDRIDFVRPVVSNAA